MSSRRVAVTGIGIVCPIGIARDGLWQGLQARRSAVRTITRFDPSLFRSHNGAEVDEFQPTDFLEAKRAKRLDRFGHFAVASAKLALDDAGIDLAREDRERVGSTMGSALGGVAYAESQMHVFYEKGLKAIDPALALMVFAGAASCNIAIEFGIQGPNSTNAMSCASGTMAIGAGFRVASLSSDNATRRHHFRDARLYGRGIGRYGRGSNRPSAGHSTTTRLPAHRELGTLSQGRCWP